MLSRLEISAFDRHPRNATTALALVELLRARKGMTLHRTRREEEEEIERLRARARALVGWKITIRVAEIIGPVFHARLVSR